MESAPANEKAMQMFPDVEQLKSHLTLGALVVDLVPPVSAEANRDGVLSIIDGSLSAPWDREAQTMPLSSLPENKDAPMIVCCKSGKRAAEAIEYLKENGYTNAINGGGPMGPLDLWAALSEARGANSYQLGSLEQMFDSVGASSTLTYILADPHGTKEAIIIDPVLENVERDVALIERLGCELTLALNTHCHADHITGTGALKKLLNDRPGKAKTLQSLISKSSGAKADILVEDGEVVRWADGKRELRVLATPGHTNGCVSFYDKDVHAVFTGDALFIGGCGRTDFQEGSASTLYDSVHKKLFTLPPHTLVYPAHDYKGRRRSTIGAESKGNPRLTKSKDDFVSLMDNLGLPYPKKIDASLPANLVCGIQD